MVARAPDEVNDVRQEFRIKVPCDNGNNKANKYTLIDRGKAFYLKPFSEEHI